MSPYCLALGGRVCFTEELSSMMWVNKMYVKTKALDSGRPGWQPASGLSCRVSGRLLNLRVSSSEKKGGGRRTVTLTYKVEGTMKWSWESNSTPCSSLPIVSGTFLCILGSELGVGPQQESTDVNFISFLLSAFMPQALGFPFKHCSRIPSCVRTNHGWSQPRRQPPGSYEQLSSIPSTLAIRVSQ